MANFNTGWSGSEAVIIPAKVEDAVSQLYFAVALNSAPTNSDPIGVVTSTASNQNNVIGIIAHADYPKGTTIPQNSIVGVCVFGRTKAIADASINIFSKLVTGTSSGNGRVKTVSTQTISATFDNTEVINAFDKVGLVFATALESASQAGDEITVFVNKIPFGAEVVG